MKIKNNFEIFIITLTVSVVFISLYSTLGSVHNISIFNSIFDFIECITTQITNDFEFHNNSFERNIDAETILSTIAAVLAGILTIVFAVSLFNIQIISEKYTPHLLDYYAHNRDVKALLYLSIINLLICVLILFIHDLLPYFVSYVILLTILISFVINILLFVRYFYKILKVINPINLADLLKDKCIENIKKQNEQDAKKIITVLGDICIKSIQRKEEDISKKYITILRGISGEYLTLISKNPSKYEIVPYPNHPEKKKNIHLLYVLEQDYRLFKEAIINGDEVVAKEIIHNVSSIISDLLFRYNSGFFNIYNKQFLFNEVLSCWYMMCDFSIKNKSNHRVDLIRHLIGTLQASAHMPEVIVNEDVLIHRYVETDILSERFLFNINQLMINFNDFELFKNEISDIAWYLDFLDEPKRTYQEIKNDLYLTGQIPHLLFSDEEFIKQLEKKRNYLRFMIEKEQVKNFSTSYSFEREFKNNLDDYKDFVIKCITKLESETNKSFNENINKIIEVISLQRDLGDDGRKSIKEKLFNLYSASLIYKTFFVIGAYILFSGYNDKIKEPERYINELWTHTKQKDADADWVNKTPVTFDTFWLTNLLLYGGNNDPFWTHKYDFESFHGTTEYVYKYYLLCVTKKRTGIGLPSKDSLNRLKEKGMFYEVNWWYRFLENFKSITEKLVEHCNKLIEESKLSDRWDILFEDSARKKFEDTKGWIEKTKEECDNLMQNIEKILPLAPKKVEEYRKEILAWYNKLSKIKDLIELKEFDEKRDKELSFITICREELFPRCWLIDPYHVDCSSIWQDFDRSIVFDEVYHLIKKVLQSNEIERIKIGECNIEEIYKVIVSNTNDLKKQGFNPSVIIMPRELLLEFEETSSDKIVYENYMEFLKIDGNSKLELIRDSKLECIIILDKYSGIWTFKPDEKTKERIQIDISEYDKNKDTVNVLVKTVVNFRIMKPDRIKILEIEKKLEGE